jgi:hypothetical protein
MKSTKFERAISQARRRPVVKLDPIRPGRDNPRYGAITLSEYRVTYPESAAMPTISQRGVLRQILERQQKRHEALVRRRAMRARILEVAAEVAAWLRNALSHPASGAIGEPVPLPVRNIASDRF